MRRDQRVWVALIALIPLLGACGGGSPGASDAGARLDAADCGTTVASRWNRIARQDSANTSATEGNGAVTLTASHVPPAACQPPGAACPEPAIELTQGGSAEADFEATAAFETFSPGGPGSAAALRFDLGTGEVGAYVRWSDRTVLEVFVAHEPTASMPTTATSGTFRVVRHGGVVSVAASDGATSVEAAAPIQVAARPQILAKIGIYNRGDAVIDSPTSIRFTDFQMNGSTAIQSDTFDCP